MPLWGLGSSGGFLLEEGLMGEEGGEDLVRLEGLFWGERVRVEIARRVFFSERGVGVGRRRERLDFDIFLVGG